MANLTHMKNTHHNTTRLGFRFPLMLAAFALATAYFVSTGCRSKPTVEDTNDHLELIDYIQRNEVGRSLFRTNGFISDVPYTRPSREGVLFRDVLDSVARKYFTDIPSYFVEKDFGSPFGIVDDAEVEVRDIFYVRILADSAGTPLPTYYQQRALYRRAYFLRLRSERDAYSGWLMHGYNGGIPRNALMEITKPNGVVFRGDGLRFERFIYMQYITKEWTGDDNIVDSITVDTVAGRSDYAYVLLQDIERVTKGDALVIESQEVDDNSRYQLIAAETADGPIYRPMHHPDSSHYVDTISTPATTGRIWDIMLFQEFQGPGIDRPGGIWAVPYRLQ